MKTFYDLLGVRPDADAEALKTAFRKAVKANHPDLHPEDPRVLSKFRQIVDANSILSDAVQRAAYDHLLKLKRQRRRLEGRVWSASAAIVFSVALVGAHWINYAPRSQTTLTAIDSDRGVARPEIVADEAVATIVGNSPYEGRDDAANVLQMVKPIISTAATDLGPAIANAKTASHLGTRVDAADTNYDRIQPIVDAVAVSKPPLMPAGSVPAMQPQSVPTPVVPAAIRPASLPPLATSFSHDPMPARPASRQLTDQTTVDRKALQLEWSAKDALAPAKSQRFGASEVALMMEKGAALIANGDIGAARAMFQRAAEAGDPAGTFALAETYDPLVLGIMGTKGGITSDIALANSGYEKAKELGLTAAPREAEEPRAVSPATRRPAAGMGRKSRLRAAP